MMNFSAAEMGLGTTGQDGRPRVFVGKGSAPRNCQSKAFRDNYEEINWGRKEESRDANDQELQDGEGI